MLSIVMPAYNEADIIESAVREWYDEVVSRVPGSEMIVVDDCSKDATGAVLDSLAKKLPQLRVIRPAQNGGHGKALRFGFQNAGQEWVFQTDSDRQHLPTDFWSLWESKDDFDFMMGVRRRREDGTFRIMITRTMRLLNALIWGVWVTDANCPFKLMRRGRLEKVLDRIPTDSFIPMVMVSILARKMGFHVREVLVTHLPRRGGQQSLKGILRWLRVGSRCASQLIRLRLSIRNG
jgi:glycosyltransferase involved in cell wall biosynthesis